MESIFFQYLTFFRPIGYAAAFLGVALEGDVVLLAFAFIESQRFFDPGDMFIVIYVGALVGDSFFYWLGAKIQKEGSLISRWAGNIGAPFDEHIINRPIHTIFISKLAYGIHHALLTRAGMLRVGFKKMFFPDIIAVFFWELIIGGLGYLSGAYFVLVKRYLHFAEVGLLIAILLFVGISHIVKKYSTKYL